MALTILGRRILAVIAPEQFKTADARRFAAEEARARQSREFAMTPDGHGSVWLRGRLDTEAAAIVRAALDPLARPMPTAADGPDPRSPSARRADALVEVCRRALAAGELPDNGGERPQVVVAVPLRTLTEQVGAGTLDDGTGLCPAAAYGRLVADLSAGSRDAVIVYTTPRPGCHTARRGRSATRPTRSLSASPRR